MTDARYARLARTNCRLASVYSKKGSRYDESARRAVTLSVGIANLL